MPGERGRNGTRVLGYARVSSVDQTKGTSLQDQQDAITAYAQSRGLKVERFYVESESGIHEKIERREQIQRLMRDVRRGDLVLCDKLDRWSRDPEFTYGSVRRIIEAGANWYAVGDRCDPSTQDGDTMLGFRVLFAREEHKRIKLRLVGTRQILRDKGYYVEGLPPVGYRRPPRKGTGRLEHNVLVIDEGEAVIVRDIFRRCVRGQSIGAIQEHLNREHRQRAWDKKLLTRVLHNRVYLGEIESTHGEWIKGHHAPILEPDLFAKAQDALAARRLGGSGPHKDSRTKDWLLRRIGRCARCGGKLGPAYGGGASTGAADYTYYYVCPKRCPGSRYMRVRDFDSAVSDMILGHLVELREQFARGPEPKKAAKVLDFASERARIQQRRARFQEAFADDGGITVTELRAHMAKLDAELLRLDAKEAEHKRTSPLEDPAVRRQMLESIDTMRKSWRRALPHVRRELLHYFARAVHIELGRYPVIEWKTPAELAEEVYP